MTSPRPRQGVLAVSLALSLVVLAGCSGDGDDPSSTPTAPSDTASATPTEPPPYLPVPDGVELTEQGRELKVGQEAVVAYEPRQNLVGVLGVTVDRIERTTFAKSFDGWALGPGAEGTTPYFVRATITNNGLTDLGGRPVPLYVVNTADTLIEASTFEGTFKPCPSKPFPKRFKTGAKVETCLAYLTPKGTKLEAVSFRPTQEFDPITWTGPITKPLPDKPKKPKKGKKGDDGQQGDGG